MNKKSNFVEGGFIATVAIVISKILGMLYVIPFYKMVGVQGSALYAYAYSIYVIFLDISTGGIPSSISKIVSECNSTNKENVSYIVYKVGNKLMLFISIVLFTTLFIFSKSIASLLIGNLEGGNSIEDVSFVIKCVSFALLIIPTLSVGRGYLQGNKYIKDSSISQVLEQVVRILVILGGCYLVIYVFKKSIKLAIGVSVFAAFISGVVATLFVRSKIYNKRSINKVYLKEKDIVKRIIKYSL